MQTDNFCVVYLRTFEIWWVDLWAKRKNPRFVPKMRIPRHHQDDVKGLLTAPKTTIQQHGLLNGEIF